MFPKLPYSPKQFEEILCNANNRKEKGREFLGYFIEWEGKVSSYNLEYNKIVLILDFNEGSLLLHSLFLHLPLTYFEIVKTLRKGQRLRACGIIFEIFIGMIQLNYVDFEITEETAEPTAF